jgi:hypothetical protein
LGHNWKVHKAPPTSACTIVRFSGVSFFLELGITPTPSRLERGQNEYRHEFNRPVPPTYMGHLPLFEFAHRASASSSRSHMCIHPTQNRTLATPQYGGYYMCTGVATPMLSLGASSRQGGPTKTMAISTTNNLLHQLAFTNYSINTLFTITT